MAGDGNTVVAMGVAATSRELGRWSCIIVEKNRAGRAVVTPLSCDRTNPIHLVAHIYVLTYDLAMPAALAVLDVIAEPTRRRILDAVREAECSVNDLVEQVGMHQPGVSRHLKVLRDAGLVEVRRDAQRRMYRLRAEPLMELDAWLEPYRAQWAGRLDALERHLKRTSTPITPDLRRNT